MLTIDGAVARLRLDRPDQGNALDLSTAHALRDAVQTIGATPDLRAVVISASGPRFCAGGDVRAMAAADDAGAFVLELAGLIHEALIALRALPIPVVAAVQATAAGAGLGLLLAADIAIAADGAKFVSAYDRIGLTPDCGVSALLPAVIGSRRAARFALEGLTLDAATACDWGLISEVCPAAELDDRVEAVLARLTASNGPSLGETARLLRWASERSHTDQLDDEAATISRLAAGPAASELIAAFAAR